MLSRTPFVSIALIFMSGILLAGIVPVQWTWVRLLAAVNTALLVMYIILITRRKMQASGLVFALFVLCTGIISKLVRDMSLSERENALALADYDAYVAQVKSLPEKRMQTVRVEATVRKIRVGGKWSEVSLNTLLSFPKDTRSIPAPGSSLLVYGKLTKPQAATESWQFDYRKYLRNKGILVTGRLRPG